MVEAGAALPAYANGPRHATAAPSDETLMERYRDGDAAAFDLLYARHKGGTFRYVLRLCGRRAVAEELFQDVWMQLVRARDTYAVRAKFTTYLYRIAHNRVIDHYRASGALPRSFEEAAEAMETIAAPRGDDPALAAEIRQDARQVLALVAALPEAQREAWILQQETDMDIEDIARATGVSRETAKSRLRYAWAKLRAALKEAA